MGARPPSVDRLAGLLAGTGLPYPLLVDAARSALAGNSQDAPVDSIIARALESAAATTRRLMQPVINATGVLLHTNLGRAPIGAELVPRYTNVEFDLNSGQRGDRSAHAPALLGRACGADDVMVVNNGAAALFLVASALATAGEVIVSRGELVEIGGGFRIPEILAASGTQLVEVGTTNRTRLGDYEVAVTERTALILKVHTSNYRIVGFTESAEISELTQLPGNHPIVADLGSGLLDENCPWLQGGPPPWLRGEPAVRQSLARGAALVVFSGDKLLGGPQCGVIAGRADLVEKCRRHPLARVLRPGGITLELLQEVALAYLDRDVARRIPLWRLATAPVEELRRRARDLGAGQVVDCSSTMGGGALPQRGIPSVGIALPGDRRALLRANSVPVIARVFDGSTICDLRTVFPEQDESLARVLVQCR